MEDKIPSNLICNNDDDKSSLNDALKDIEPFVLHIKYTDGEIPLLRRHIKSLDHFGIIAAMKAHIRSSLEQFIVSDLIKNKSGVITVIYDENQDIILNLDNSPSASEISVDEALAQAQNTIWAFDEASDTLYYRGGIYKAVDTLSLDLLKTLKYKVEEVSSQADFNNLAKSSNDVFCTSNSSYLIPVRGKCGKIYDKLKSCFEKV